MRRVEGLLTPCAVALSANCRKSWLGRPVRGPQRQIKRARRASMRARSPRTHIGSTIDPFRAFVSRVIPLPAASPCGQSAAVVGDFQSHWHPAVIRWPVLWQPLSLHLHLHLHLRLRKCLVNRVTSGRDAVPRTALTPSTKCSSGYDKRLAAYGRRKILVSDCTFGGVVAPRRYEREADWDRDVSCGGLGGHATRTTAAACRSARRQRSKARPFCRSRTAVVPRKNSAPYGQ